MTGVLLTRRLDSGPWRHNLLLAGGGHTHALLLRRWLMRPHLRPTATRVSLVSRHGSLAYFPTFFKFKRGFTQKQNLCQIEINLKVASPTSIYRS